MIELKPCPFCGGKPDLCKVGDRKQYYAFVCSQCGRTTVRNSDARCTVWGARRIWNRRVGEEKT